MKNGIECKHCQSKDAIKYGHRYNKKGEVQVYSCKSCKKTFTETTTFSKMKHKEKVITVALDLYMKGVSLRKIKDHLEQIHDVRVSHVTILNWIKKYSSLLKEYTDQFQVNTSGTLHADEMMVKVGGDWMWLWDVMDRSTKFVLSSHLSEARGMPDAKKIFLESKEKLTSRPISVTTDGLQMYRRAINNAFYTNTMPRTQHISLVGFRDKINNNVIERLHGSIRERTKVMRGFSEFTSAKKIIDCWSVYYNFIRPHMSLDGMTPAEAAGVDLELNGGDRWLELIKLSSERKKPAKVKQ